MLLIIETSIPVRGISKTASDLFAESQLLELIFYLKT
jgi:hypothetical protein